MFRINRNYFFSCKVWNYDKTDYYYYWSTISTASRKEAGLSCLESCKSSAIERARYKGYEGMLDVICFCRF